MMHILVAPKVTQALDYADFRAFYIKCDTVYPHYASSQIICMEVNRGSKLDAYLLRRVPA